MGVNEFCEDGGRWIDDSDWFIIVVRSENGFDTGIRKLQLKSIIYVADL